MGSDAAVVPSGRLMEPQLKYEELAGDVQGITSASRVTCLCLSDKILAIGTQDGSVHVLDYSGHEVRCLDLHRGPVNDLSFDNNGEHIASCSDDCSVTVTNLYTDVRQRYPTKQPIKSIALDPRYASRRTKEYVTASDSGLVQLSTQGWLGRSDYTLHEGQAQLVRWSDALSGSIVAWGSDKAVWVYDTNSHLQIRTISRYPPARKPNNKGFFRSSTPAPPSTSAPASTPASAAASGAASASIASTAASSSVAASGGAKPGALGAAGAAAAADASASAPAGGRWPQEHHLSLLFGQDNKLYMGWPDCIKVARLFVTSNNIGSASPQVEVIADFYTNYFVLGVSPFGEDLAVLSYPTPSDATAATEATGATGATPGAASTEAEASGSRGAAQGSGQGADAPRQEAVKGGAGVAAAGQAAAGSVGASPPPGVDASVDAIVDAGKVEPGQRPQLCIVSTSNQLLAQDDLPIRGWDQCGPNDYSLVPSLPATTAEATSTKRKLGHKSQQSDAAATASATAGVTAGATTATQQPAVQQQPDKQQQAHSTSSTFKAADVESMYFIVSPQSILASCTRDANDHVLWLLGQSRFNEALEIAEADRGVHPDTYEKVVQGYIDDLLKREAYETAAQLSPRLLKKNGALWERWVYLFAQIRQLPKLAPYIPTDDPQLRETAYEMVLRSLLLDPQDHPMLLNLVRTWPRGLVSMPLLVDVVAARMKRPGGENDHLWRLLALLYQRQGRPDLSLSILLQLRAADVFEFIEAHSLVGELLGGRAATLLDINEAAALKLLTRNVDVLQPSAVVPGLKEAMDSASARGAEEEAEVWRRRLYRYLAGVLELDASAAADYHELQVQLTADYDPRKLMDFLTASQHYPLEAALSICERRGMVKEQVYILGRMGNSRQALHLIIDKLGDIPQAIEFARSQRDEELWDYLITWALGSAETTGSLLDHVGGYINPLTLIQRLPKGLAVPRLRDRIRAIIGDFRTQYSLHEGCSVILRSDCMGLMSRLYKEARACVRQCYVERRERGGAGQLQWHRYNTMTGQYEHVPVHSMPAALLSSANASLHPANGRAQAGAMPRALAGRQAAAGRLWIGFNVEDAETHIKLASKEDAPGDKAGARGGKRAAKRAGKTDEDGEGQQQQQGQAPMLPSLVRQEQAH